MKFQVIARDNEESKEVARLITNKLRARDQIFDEVLPDVIIFIGGDGTFLRVVHEQIKRINQIKLVGVNLGALGFFCDYNKDEISLLVEDILTDNVLEKKYRLLDVKLIGKDFSEQFNAVNEVRIENPFHTLVCEVNINGQKLEDYHGNGIVVASSVGSSAYNKSLGGALIECEIPLLELTEIAPIQNAVYQSLGSSLVMDAKNVVSLNGDFSRIVVGYDHLIHVFDKKIDHVEITSSELSVCLLRKRSYNYVDKIRKSFVAR